VDKAFQKLKDDWLDYFNSFSVLTPDTEMNQMLNFWNALQCRTNLYWSRFISGYDTGLGRGMGTRDSAQDTLGTVHSLPTQTRQVLINLWRLQFQEGHTWHLFFPLTGEEVMDWLPNFRIGRSGFRMITFGWLLQSLLIYGKQAIFHC
jgi:cellobiose phosphorylase